MKWQYLLIILLLICISTDAGAQAIKTKPAKLTSFRDFDWNYWSNTPHMFAMPAGNVGIGTMNPATKLEVAGLVYSNAGGFQFPDGTIQATAFLGGGYARVFTVAQGGGTHTTITAALAACVAPGPGNRYLVRVMPGTYTESIVCLGFVDMKGSGKNSCHINGSVTGADDCIIDGFFIDGGVVCPGVSPTISRSIISNEGYGIEVMGPARPWITECEVQNCTNYGIFCNGWESDPWIICNRIRWNDPGGILCIDSAPTIQNNQVRENNVYGIYMQGALGFPSEPTISDNVIGRNNPDGGGIGIYMIGYVEPRILSNDIYVNWIGIEIHASTQPSIQGNNIGYNRDRGIVCFSSGASKPVTIKGNHIHGNPTAGVDIQLCTPIVTHNNINFNDPLAVNPDITYAGPPFPMISMNVYDRNGGVGAAGLYNVTSAGAAILP